MKKKRDFKQGDKVRIRTWADMKKEFGEEHCGSCRCILAEERFTLGMKPLCGKVAYIEGTFADGRVSLGGWRTKQDTNWTFSADMLEHAD